MPEHDQMHSVEEDVPETEGDDDDTSPRSAPGNVHRAEPMDEEPQTIDAAVRDSSSEASES